jgi:periplasmic divalent cation tolerance protein
MAVTSFCVVQTTLDDEDKAEALASALLEQKLAACIQIAPVQSRYLWRDVFTREKEFVLSIKARAADFDAIAAQIRALHSYEIPEIIAVPILAGDPAYLDWVEKATERE